MPRLLMYSLHMRIRPDQERIITSLTRNTPKRAISKTCIQACQVLLLPKSRGFKKILQKTRS